MTQKGQHRRALGFSLLFSVFRRHFWRGRACRPPPPTLARFAAKFTPFEYFWFFVLGLSCAATVSGQSTAKACFALFFGMLVSTIGLGTDYSKPRLTFGIDFLIEGINFIPAMIGLFGVSEILRNVSTLRHEVASASVDKVDKGSTGSFGSLIPIVWKRKVALLRSSVIGSFIGMLPGAGADIAAWVSYAVSKRFSRTPENYGSGSEEGLADATGANNAALGSAWIPAVVFGIPGDSVTAIALGVLLMKNVTPGPNIFDIPPETTTAPLVYSLYVAFVYANLILIPLGLIAIHTGSFLIKIPRRVLLPIILIFCIVGSYAMNGSYFDVGVMGVMGLIGFLFDRFNIPLGPVVLGIILGTQVEHRFIQCLTTAESFGDFFNSGISIFLSLACALLWAAALGLIRRR